MYLLLHFDYLRFSPVHISAMCKESYFVLERIVVPAAAGAVLRVRACAAHLQRVRAGVFHDRRGSSAAACSQSSALASRGRWLVRRRLWWADGRHQRVTTRVRSYTTKTAVVRTQ